MQMHFLLLSQSGSAEKTGIRLQTAGA